jgi:flagellar protein FliO/FliZ
MELADYLKFFFALLFVLSLMGGLALIMKRLGLGHGNMISGSKRRLKIIEMLPIDSRHKAVLIQRDNTEHLVVLSNSGDTVIETNIKKPQENSSDDQKA